MYKKWYQTVMLAKNFCDCNCWWQMEARALAGFSARWCRLCVDNCHLIKILNPQTKTVETLCNLALILQKFFCLILIYFNVTYVQTMQGSECAYLDNSE